MFNALLSPARRRQLGVCGALLAVSAFAACDKTDPTAPLTKPPGTSSKLAGPGIPQTVISIKIVDEKNNLVKYPGAYFEIFGPLGIHKFVDDGGADDADQAFGSVKIVGLANGSYKVCEIMVAQYFSFPPDSNCISGNLAPGGQLNMTFFNPRPPALQWGVTNDVGVLIGGGASFLVKDSLGTSWTVTDDQPEDAMPWPGSLETFATHPGTWTICESAAPSGYVKPVGQPCFNIVVTWGSIGFAGNFANNPPYALNWGVTEGVLDANNNYVPLAGTTFTVAYGRGLSKTTVTDNGPGDYEPASRPRGTEGRRIGLVHRVRSDGTREPLATEAALSDHVDQLQFAGLRRLVHHAGIAGHLHPVIAFSRSRKRPAEWPGVLASRESTE